MTTISNVEELMLMLKPWVLEGMKGIVWLVFAWVISNWIAKVCQSLLKKSKIEKTVRKAMENAIYVFLKIIVLTIVLSSLGVKMSIIAAMLGGFSIAFGLALKNNISNIADGILLLMARPFKVGDYIETSFAAGTIEQLNLFTTELKTPNNFKLFVPNSKLFSAELTNFTSNPTRRIDIVLGLSYDDNLQEGADILKKGIQELDLVLTEPAVDVWFTDFGDSSVNLVVRAWCLGPDFLKTRHQLILNIHKLCDANNLHIPFPQRELHLSNSLEIK